MSAPRKLTDLCGTPESPVRLFCVPHAGAGSLGYRSWAPYLPGEVAMTACVLPGRDHRLREPPAERMADVINELGAAVAARIEHRYVLFGHSMGALIAYGIARRLGPDHPPPLAVIVSGSPAPHVARRERDAHLLGDDEFTELARGLGGTDDNVFAHPELRKRMLALLRADFALTASFAPVPGELDCPLIGIHGNSDNWVSRESVRSWRAHTNREFRYAEVNGGHFVPVDDPAAFVSLLLAELSALSPNSSLAGC